ncbi:hypothetical protein TKK_0012106 [Trichogramma kaykai]
MRAAVESCATHNFIRPNLVEKNNSRPTDYTHSKLAVARAEAETVGVTTIEFSTNGQNFQAEALVTPRMWHDLVLGIPFVEKEEAILDFQRRVLHLGKNRRTTAALAGDRRKLVSTKPLPSHGFPPQYAEEVQCLLTEFRHALIPESLGGGIKSPVHEIKLTVKCMNIKSKEYTALTTPTGGTYQFCFMPFGLKVEGSTFQKLMSQVVLTGYLNKFCIVFLDDIVINISTQKIEYLGFLVDQGGNKVKPSYLEAVVCISPPTSKKELQSFYGACNWLHEYVPGLAIRLVPLTDLLRARRGFTWISNIQVAFDDLKNVFRQPLRLTRLHPNKTFIL